MKVVYSQSSDELGKKAAKHAADLLRQYIAQNGSARLLLSTGASQFATLSALTEEALDWTKVEMFHLDEYLGITPQHSASFVKYLQERFVDKVNLGKVHYVDTSEDADKLIAKLSSEIGKRQIDVGLIGIGENAHIAFNDPPADFDTTEAFTIVTLIESCRQQQMGEGWFPTLEDVPTTAITITVSQIMKCKCIVSAVPYKAKAEAIYKTLTATESTPKIPASILRTHPNATLLIDKESSALVNDSIIDKASL